MFKKPFKFKGRIGRLEFGISMIITNAYLMVLLILLNLSFGFWGFGNAYMLPLIFFPFVIPAYWFAFAQGAKRCHDLGNSGWFQLIPLYGFWLLFANSEHGDNGFGPNPKGIGNVDEIDQIGGYIQAQ